LTKDEALKLALEALENLYSTCDWYGDDGREAMANAPKAIAAIKEALMSTQCEKQPAQEPIVGTKTWFEDGKIVTQNLRHSDVYTTPPAAPMQEPKFVRMVDGVPCITLAEHKHLMAAKEKNT
jgi:hypothetical protein